MVVLPRDDPVPDRRGCCLGAFGVGRQADTERARSSPPTISPVFDLDYSGPPPTLLDGCRLLAPHPEVQRPA